MQDLQKENCAKKAMELVKDGMVIGLGSGSTLVYFTRFLGHSNLNVKVVVSSKQILKVAEEVGLEIVDFESVDKIDLAVDGADQVDKEFNLLKGLGAFAVVGEKKLDYFAEKCVIVVDESKISNVLDRNVILEINPHKLESVKKALMNFDCKIVKETMHEGNSVVFLDFGVIKNSAELEQRIDAIDGVNGNGIFANFKQPIDVIVGKNQGAEFL
ncbi:MAG: ribose 5-phosphate isomerase A [Candidatus Diapherotrites archaeon]